MSRDTRASPSLSQRRHQWLPSSRHLEQRHTYTACLCTASTCALLGHLGCSSHSSHVAAGPLQHHKNRAGVELTCHVSRELLSVDDRQPAVDKPHCHKGDERHHAVHLQHKKREAVVVVVVGRAWWTCAAVGRANPKYQAGQASPVQNPHSTAKPHCSCTASTGIPYSSSP